MNNSLNNLLYADTIAAVDIPPQTTTDSLDHNYQQHHRLSSNQPQISHQNNLKYYYNISDILIQTSSYETWGLTINESLASGTPVICTKDCGASHDLIKNKKVGKMYSTGNINELDNKMKRLLIKKNKINQTNIKKTIANNTIDKTLNSIHKILYGK